MSMYKALYRAYRPNTFEQIVGQRHVVTTLQNTITQQKIGHAYLFHGPRGTGKTSIAKIFAAAVNCEASDPSLKPCHACASCQLIDSGQATDIIELDAASNSGVDEIRQIREFVRYAPTQLSYKVYIIDEVHMLSTAAFNALLKTLEEPPAHVIFILATTESHKIPVTIISRTQRFDFKKVSVDDIIAGIAPILQKEQIDMSMEALTYLAEYADGGMRDALSVLDQMRSYKTGQITLQDVHDVVGTIGHDVYAQLLNDVMQKNMSAVLLLLDEIVASGKNVQLFLEGFLRYLLTEAEQKLKHGLSSEAGYLLQMSETMNQIAGQIRTALLPQVALRAGFLTMINAQDETTLVQDNVGVEAEATPVMEKMGVQQEDREAHPAQVQEAIMSTPQDAPAPEPVEQAAFADQHERQVDVLDLYNADNFAPEETVEVEEEKQEVITKRKVKPPIKDEAVARASLGRAMDEAITKMKTQEIMLKDIQSLPPESSEDARPPLTHNEGSDMPLNNEYDEHAVVSTTPLDRAPTSAAQTEETVEHERHRLLLWRSMVEVVLRPECNELEKVKRKWQTLKFDPSNQIIVMLLDMEPKIATKTHIVLSSFNKSLTNQLQIRENKRNAEAFITELVGSPYTIVVVDEGGWMRERGQFSQDWKANRISQELFEELTEQISELDAQSQMHREQTEQLLQGENNTAKPQRETEPIVQAAVDLFGEEIVEVK